MDMISTEDQQRRKLRYRALHRGTKEADHLIGNFVNGMIDQLDALQLDQLETLLDCTDIQLMAWGFAQEIPPIGLQGNVMSQLQDYFAQQAGERL